MGYWALLGLVVPAVRFPYDYAWFVGLAVAGGAHWAVGRASRTGSMVGSGAEVA